MEREPIALPMPIVTSRLTLRPIQIGDGALIHDAVVESWSELSRWLVWTLKPLENLTVGDYEDFCRKKQEMYSKREDITLLSFDKNSGKLLGGCGLHKPDWSGRTFSIGFWVRSSETGKGYATEVVNALVDYGFKKLAACRLLSFHAEGNEGSRAVLQKTGFHLIEVVPQEHKLLDKNVDEYRYTRAKEFT